MRAARLLLVLTTRSSFVEPVALVAMLKSKAAIKLTTANVVDARISKRIFLASCQQRHTHTIKKKEYRKKSKQNAVHIA